VQIDRMGRAGVNTALTNPFFRESVASEESQHEIILDDYNAANDPSQWVARFSSLIAPNLAILDGLDRVCGNEFWLAQRQWRDGTKRRRHSQTISSM
jgi:hypothetical protein